MSHCVSKPVWTCPECFEEIKHKKNVKRHKSICNKPRNPKPSVEIKCDVCDKLFSSKSNLTKHSFKIHGISKSKLLPCGFDNCQFMSDSKPEIKKHITLNHSGKPKLMCTVCKAVYHSSSGLQNHTLTVHRVPCSNCLETFSNQKKLRIHMLKTHPTLLPRPVVIVRRAIEEHSSYSVNYYK